MDDLARLARTLRALPPSAGPVRLIAVDGHAGSGKSTFAARLAGALAQLAAEEPAAESTAGFTAEPAGEFTADGSPGVPVLHLDDLASHDELFDWTDRMLAQVVEPFAGGTAAHYAPYDWVERCFTAPRAFPAAPVVLVEGVGAGRRALRPRLAALLWMERDAESSWQRGRRRDGSALDAFWDGWTMAEMRHFSADPSRPFADALVRECRQGYEVLPGPRTNARENQIITLGHHRLPPG